MSWFSKKPKTPKHVHNWTCLRATNYTLKKAHYIDPSDFIRTQFNVKCVDCGELKTVDRRGTWTREDYNA